MLSIGEVSVPAGGFRSEGIVLRLRNELFSSNTNTESMVRSLNCQTRTGTLGSGIDSFRIAGE
jgi:hypothetical protein